MKHGLNTDSIPCSIRVSSVARYPDFGFRILNFKTGRIHGKPADAPPDKTPLRFLKELHFTAGYPSQNGTSRWFWAVAVDATVLSLFFWALSGLFMWWQIKAARLTGIATLLASATLATALTLAMHRLLMF